MRKNRQSSQQYHLALLGPTSVKAARKTLVKLTPGWESLAQANKPAWENDWLIFPRLVSDENSIRHYSVYFSGLKSVKRSVDCITISDLFKLKNYYRIRFSISRENLDKNDHFLLL